MLQVQEYGNTPNPPKPEDAKATPAPATEQALKWYDVDVVKGTQFTVTAYQVPIEDPTKVRRGVVS